MHDEVWLDAIDYFGLDGCEPLLRAARGIVRAERLGHVIWGDGHPVKHGWFAMLAWNLAIASLCAAARRFSGTGGDGAENG